nr:PAS domain-containing protein [Marinicella sp. W31]MDC2876594.1 PAS domain-containing protein [Marinicella sp. W31]
MDSELPQTADTRPVVQTLNRAPERVLLVDPYGLIEIANEAALSFLGAGETDVCGTSLVSWFSEANRKDIERAMARVLSDDPGNRLEEVSADFSGGSGGSSQLSIARMRHRDGVCVVVSPTSGMRQTSHRTVPMPKVDNTEFGIATPESGRPLPVRQERDSAPVNSQMPWNTLRTRSSAEPVRPQRISKNVFARQPSDQENEATDLEYLHSSMPAPAISGRAETLQPKTIDSASTAEGNTIAQTSPASPSTLFNRDIYAEFETERDRKERQHDTPLISPEKCLRAALQQYRSEALAESITLVTKVGEGGRGVPVDDVLLTALFSHLIERLIAVSPPYCDAQITLEATQPEGFLARFTDIGRGLSENELDAVFSQPELSMGISHTCLVKAQEAASGLGLKFSVRTAVETGTTVEVAFID